MRELAFITIGLVASIVGCTTVADDAVITRNIESSFDRQADLGPPNQLSVKTLNHVVYLSGSTSTGLQRDTAMELALQTPGVSRLVNTVTVAH